MNKERQKVWQLLRSYEGDVLGYLKQAVGDGETARDIFQEVYLKALENLEHLDARRSLKNWLLTVARNRVLNYYRDSTRFQFKKVEEQDLVSGQGELKEDPGLRFALSQLPPRQRKIFLQRELEELSYQQLAEAFGMSVSAVTSLLKRARENVKKQYRLFYLPDWARKNGHDLPVEDLIRFVKPEGLQEQALVQALEQSQRYFSAVRARWDHLRDRFFSQDRLSAILQFLQPLQSKTILDAGSGTGMVAVNAAIMARRVLALEINAGMIAHLNRLKKQLVLKNLHIVRNDIRRLCVRRATIDAVFSVLVLHHLPQPGLWFNIAANSLKPNGHLVVVEFNRHGDKQLADTMHDLWLGFNPDLIKKWAKKCNLNCVYFEEWKSAEGVPVFVQIFKKMK